MVNSKLYMTMKKIYLQPAILVEDADMEQIIAASVDGFNSELDDSGMDGSNALVGAEAWSEEW